MRIFCQSSFLSTLTRFWLSKSSMLDSAPTSLLLPTAPPLKTTSFSTLKWFSPTLVAFSLCPKAAATDSGVWPEEGGPQGSLGESLKRWTHQPGIPLVSARWDEKFSVVIILMSGKIVTQRQVATSPSHKSGWPSRMRRRWRKTHSPQDPSFIQERRWDLKVIFDSGSAWINAGDGASTMISFADQSKVPLVVGGIGYFRWFSFNKFFTFAQGELWQGLVAGDCWGSQDGNTKNWSNEQGAGVLEWSTNDIMCVTADHMWCADTGRAGICFPRHEERCSQLLCNWGRVLLPRWSIYLLLLLFLEFCNLQFRWTLVLCSHMRSAQECWMDLLCQDFEGDTRIDVFYEHWLTSMKKI